MRKNFYVMLIVSALFLQTAAFAQSTNVSISAAEKKMAETIKAEKLSHWLHFISSDAMGGRDTPSVGLDITADFLKMHLAMWGFKPAGDDGTFFQKMSLRRDSVDAAGTSLKVGERSFTINDDFVRLRGNGTASGKFVFGRDGWMVKSKGIDAFQGVDVNGKIVVISSQGFAQNTLTPRPTGVAQNELTGTKGVDWADPHEYARVRGAAGLIVIAPPQLQNNWAQVRNFGSRGGLYVEKFRDGVAVNNLPVVLVTQAVGDAIFAGETADRAAAFELSKEGSLAAAVKTEQLWTQNVVALWEGSDPVLKNEMVAIGSHYDHVGTNPNVPGDDKIFNGADDDGSGTIGMLAIAEALSKAPKRPKRSILLVWHAAEEKGLWGAEYFNKFPPVDIKNVIAQLNIDMIGRSKKPGDENPRNKDLSGPNEVYLIGSEVMSSTLGAIAKGTNAAYEKLDYNYRFDAPNDPNRFFFRSDHFHYAVNGIPVAFWFTGVHEDYHGVGDHADKIDYQKMEKITRTIFLTSWKLAELSTRPVVDKQLPPELTRR